MTLIAITLRFTTARALESFAREFEAQGAYTSAVELAQIVAANGCFSRSEGGDVELAANVAAECEYGREITAKYTYTGD